MILGVSSPGARDHNRQVADQQVGQAVSAVLRGRTGGLTVLQPAVFALVTITPPPVL